MMAMTPLRAAVISICSRAVPMGGMSADPVTAWRKPPNA